MLKCYPFLGEYKGKLERWVEVTKIKSGYCDLSIVIPCLNEAETLVEVIRKSISSIEKSGLIGEVIVADNGSTDGSQQIAVAAGAKVVTVSVRGYGAALQAGIVAANGMFVVMGDADDSYALDNLTLFLEKLNQGYDLVVGDRFAGGIEKDAMPWLHKYLGNPILSWLGRLFFRVPIKDVVEALLWVNVDASGRA